MTTHLLDELKEALPGADLAEVLAQYCGEHPRDREALGLLIDAAAEEGRDEPAR